MYKFSSAHVDACMTNVGGGVVFKEYEVSFLKVTGGSDFRPFTDRRKTRGTITARAYAAGAQTEVDQSGAVKPFTGALF